MAQTVPVKKTESIFNEIDRVKDRIMRRAYEIFESNGGTFGKDFDDWLLAEQELIWKPAIELEEKDNELRLHIAVPGVDAKDIDIEVTPEYVLVKAECRHEHKESKGEVRTCEFASGNLFRSIQLPKTIDPDKVKAEFKNGMLTLKAAIAKAAEPKTIAVAAD